MCLCFSFTVEDVIDYINILAASLYCFAFAVLCQMENTESSRGQTPSAVCIDLEELLKRLDSLSNCMDQLACMYGSSTLFLPFTLPASINYAIELTSDGFANMQSKRYNSCLRSAK